MPGWWLECCAGKSDRHGLTQAGRVSCFLGECPNCSASGLKHARALLPLCQASRSWMLVCLQQVLQVSLAWQESGPWGMQE